MNTLIGLTENNNLKVVEKEYNNHVYHLHVIKTKKRDELQKYFKLQGILTGIYYPIPLDLQPADSFIIYVC